MMKPIAAAPAALLACLSGAVAQESEPKFASPHITVRSTTSVEVRPDIATLSLGVVSEKPTAAEAESENASEATAAIAVLKGLGIDPKDIRTSNLTLAPVMVEERDPKTNGITKRTLTGYRAQNELEVSIRDIDKAGAIASRVVAAGANTYRSLYFHISDGEAREDAIRAKAVSEAKRKAALYAAGADMKLGRLLEIEPQGDEGGGAADLPTRKGADAGGPRTVVVPVEPGTISISATVSATWELLPE
jgi:hypothetical protein